MKDILNKLGHFKQKRNQVISRRGIFNLTPISADFPVEQIPK